MRAYALAALENVALWHERDISHSSVERVIGPDAFIGLDYQLHLLARVLDGLEVDGAHAPRTWTRRRGFASRSARCSRSPIASPRARRPYAMVQAAAMEAWRERRPLRECLAARAGERLNDADLDSIFDLDAFLRELEPIFTRVLATPWAAGAASG